MGRGEGSLMTFDEGAFDPWPLEGMKVTGGGGGKGRGHTLERGRWEVKHSTKDQGPIPMVGITADHVVCIVMLLPVVDQISMSGPSDNPWMWVQATRDL